MIRTSLTAHLVHDEDTHSAFKKEVLQDYYIACVSREASLVARKEVLTGKAKFGIIGDGKELPQIAMAKFFQDGDWRSGYYRDQTFMFAAGLSTVEEFFAQLYADVDNDPFSGGRQMNCHFATPLIDTKGQWLDVTNTKNVSSDISCTAGQMARALGIAMASHQYRKRSIPGSEKFSKNGNEVSFVTIGDASTSEGVFWESINAATVMRLPMITCVWDDGYGISVPKELQTTKASISKALEGFHIDENGDGMHIYRVKGWDYQDLCRVFEKATAKTRETHIPALIHVEEATQPQGHSTSGSHERYKTPERLEWEAEHDCIKMFGKWIVANHLATEDDLHALVEEANIHVKDAKNLAWERYNKANHPVLADLQAIFAKLDDSQHEDLHKAIDDLNSIINPNLGELVQKARRVRFKAHALGLSTAELDDYIDKYIAEGKSRYSTNLYSENTSGAINAVIIPPIYGPKSTKVNGFQIINAYFDYVMTHRPEVIAFGEDVGNIGDVNQGFAGLQEKYGVERVFDAGIREWSIVGQGIGSAMRGLRPIAEIQYLDYVFYAISALTDDLATLRFRSNGIQQAPLIIRTRGHRLEGIWHAGSPMATLIHCLRGMYLCVPRNMVQAVGMYQTLLQSNDPAIVIECLNGYRLKEELPENIGQYTVPLGTPEILKTGYNITVVTYGSMVKLAEKASQILEGYGVSVELIDVQTLLPFDLEGVIVTSLKKTNRILFLDEDVPGGATAYMMQEVLEKWNGYAYLDSKPATLTAAQHRTPFGSDGDYFSKPNTEDIVEKILDIMKEAGIKK